MNDLIAVYAAHPMWTWAGLAALLLAAEVLTGTGWLLWPAACAAALGVVALTRLNFGLGGDLALFAGLTIVTTLGARKLFPGLSRAQSDDDINERAGQLAGEIGVAATAFFGGDGRVSVGGAEWAARLDGGGDLPAGAKIMVVRVVDGAKLLVAPAARA